MEAGLLGLLSHDWAGLAAALLLAAIAFAVSTASRSTWFRVSAFVVVAGALVVAGGGAFHVVHMASVRRANPPPGKLVDVGGYRMHLLAEGEPHGLATLVWLPGAHEAGLALYHLHAALKGEARSILIDRPGSGWSDPGPFPRTTAVESEEVVLALHNAGEKGPFVLIGHSFGGLLAANIARRHPEIVAAVVLLDATPPDAINYAPPNPFIDDMRHTALKTGIQRLFGIHHVRPEAPPARGAASEGQRVDGLMANRLGDRLEVMADLDDAADVPFADYSIFAELARGGLGWENSVYDGELGALPVYLVAPRGIPSLDEFAKVMYAAGGPGLGPYEAYRERLRHFWDRSRERYMQVADHVERVEADAGASHNFVYENVDFVTGVLRRVLAEHPPAISP